MKRWAVVGIFFWMLLGCSALATEYELIILAGQSNAQGWKGAGDQYPLNVAADAEIPLYYVYPEGKKSNLKMNTSDGWGTLGPQTGRFPAGHFGLEVSLARAVLAEGGQPAVFKYSKGATSLCGAWGKPGRGKLTDSMLDYLAEALKQLKSDGHTVRVGAFIWIQGESDAGQPPEKINAEYKATFDALIAAVGETIGQETFPIILGVDEQHKNIVKYPDGPLALHKAYAKEHGNAAFTSMIGLEKADSTHLTPAGLVEHGKVIYEADRGLNSKK
jgi:hypothetical protein